MEFSKVQERHTTYIPLQFTLLILYMSSLCDIESRQRGKCPLQEGTLSTGIAPHSFFYMTASPQISFLKCFPLRFQDNSKSWFFSTMNMFPKLPLRQPCLCCSISRLHPWLSPLCLPMYAHHFNQSPLWGQLHAFFCHPIPRAMCGKE